MKHYTSLFLIATLILLGSCSAETDPKDWGFIQFAEVRAYYMNWDDELSMDYITNPDRTLNETRLPLEGVLLNMAQVETLRKAVTGNHPVVESADCIYPHHAFVFFSDTGEVVGAIDLCFLCFNYSGHPKGYADNWDLGAIYDLLTEIGLPISNPEWE